MMGLRFNLFGFPIAIQPFFLIMAWLIGPRNADLTTTIVWIVCVFVGVLAHEFGHALVARRFGFQPMIILHSFGGMTSWRSDRQLGYGQRILLSAAGPAVGITIGVLVFLADRAFAWDQGGLSHVWISSIVWVNFGWGVLNLLPVLPLDGGHIAMTAAEAAFGPRGRTIALIVSLVVCGILAMWMIWLGQIWMALLAVVLSFSNLQGLGIFNRKPAPAAGARHSAHSDAENAYAMARSMVLAGDTGEALKWLETAIYAGFHDGARLDNDEAWAPLRSHARFQTLRRSM